jgi:hypothetical protein
MQVTVGAKCWDGARSKSLMEKLRAEVLPQIERARGLDLKLKALLSFAVPMVFVG